MQGTSGFDVTTINPATVSLDGASPIAHFTRHFPHSEFLNETFVFVGKDINLPAGYTTATFTAQTYSGQQITSSRQVLNIPFSAKVAGPAALPVGQGHGLPRPAPLERDPARGRRPWQHDKAPAGLSQGRPEVESCDPGTAGQLSRSGSHNWHHNAGRLAADRGLARCQPAAGA